MLHDRRQKRIATSHLSEQKPPQNFIKENLRNKYWFYSLTSATVNITDHLRKGKGNWRGHDGSGCRGNQSLRGMSFVIHLYVHTCTVIGQTYL